MKHLTVINNIFSTLAKFCAIFLLVTSTGCTDEDSTYPSDDQISEEDMVTTEEMSANIESIQKFVDPLFASSATIDSLAVHIPEITALEYVKDVFVDDDILFVTLKGNLTIGYSFNIPTLASQSVADFNQTKASTPLETSSSSQSEISTRATNTVEHQHIDSILIGLIDITDLDRAAEQMQELTDSVRKANVSYTPFTGRMTLKSSNVVWLLTHGGYFQKEKNAPKLHWLIDGFLSDSTQNAIDEDQRDRKAYWSSVTNTSISVNKAYNNILYTKNKTLGKPIARWVSENYIKEIMTLQKDAIIFCGACESLKENNNLAKIFLDKGAIAYLGYTEAQGVSPIAGKHFIVNLLKGMTIEQAYNMIPASLKDDQRLYKIDSAEYVEHKDSGIYKTYKTDTAYYVQHNAQLLLHTRTSEGKNYCIVHPTIKTDSCLVGDNSATLVCKIEGWNGNQLLSGEVGICYSETKINKTPTIDNDHAKITLSNRNAQAIFVSANLHNLKTNTEYSYRAFLKLNGEIWYGDVRTFKTKDPEAYFRECLIKLYKDTDGDNWIRNKNWCSDKPLEDWVGVTKNRYTGLYSLSLNKYYMSGSIDLSGCSVLGSLYCRENQLTSINVSGCSALTDLDCGKNQLTSINVSGCSALTDLDCGQNKLTNINVLECSNLQELACNKNQLTSINVSGLSRLTHLYCSDNKLTSIDISSNPAIEHLGCSGNNITAEITKRLYDMSFVYDRRYEYSDEIYWEDHEWCFVSWTDKGYGWYYPGEPSKRGHRPPKEWMQ